MRFASLQDFPRFSGNSHHFFAPLDTFQDFSGLLSTSQRFPVIPIASQDFSGLPQHFSSAYRTFQHFFSIFYPFFTLCGTLYEISYNTSTIVRPIDRLVRFFVQNPQIRHPSAACLYENSKNTAFIRKQPRHLVCFIIQKSLRPHPANKGFLRVFRKRGFRQISHNRATSLGHPTNGSLRWASHNREPRSSTPQSGTSRSGIPQTRCADAHTIVDGAVRRREQPNRLHGRPRAARSSPNPGTPP